MGLVMKLVLTSSNPLFAEVVSAALEQHAEYEITACAPDEFVQVLTATCPDVIVVDKGMCQERYEAILAAARARTSSRVISLGLDENEIAVLNSHKEIILETEDLHKALHGESALH
jgi:DNA-binding NarL/FixJ family response regulator